MQHGQICTASHRARREWQGACQNCAKQGPSPAQCDQAQPNHKLQSCIVILAWCLAGVGAWPTFLGCMRAVNILRQCAPTLRDHRAHSERREPWCAACPWACSPLACCSTISPPSPCTMQCTPSRHLCMLSGVKWCCLGPSDAEVHPRPQIQLRSTSTIRLPLTSATWSPWRMSWRSSSWAPTGDACSRLPLHRTHPP